MPKTINVRVTTVDAVLEFPIEAKASGKQLFEQVTRTIGVREAWYFGLQYVDNKGYISWLRFDKKVVDQHVQKDPHDDVYPFKFKAKFFPEDVAEELVQEITQHLFYLQVKEQILSEEIYCSPEASILLASYAIQAEFGDYDRSTHQPGFLANEKLLPKSVMDRYEMTHEMWEERITAWYSQHKGMLREDAELEYLKVAQDLEMFGINYFEIKNKKGSQLYLGVDAFGLSIYEPEDKLSPKISFPWGEIKNVEYHGKRFSIMPTDTDRQSPDFVFYVSKTKVSDLIMQLCMGNHDLFMRQRRLDTMEVQQMKTQAKEEKARKLSERERLEREKQARQEAEKKAMDLEERLRQLEEENRVAVQQRLESEKTIELLQEKVRIAVEEAQAHARKNLQAEEEIRKVRASALKSEEERLVMERKAQMAEEKVVTVLHSTQKREWETAELKRELEEARLVWPRVKSQTSGEMSDAGGLNLSTSSNQSAVMSTHPSSPEGGSTPHAEMELMPSDDVEELSKQLEMESQDYIERSRYLAEQLNALKTQMEDMKVDEKKTHNDVLHDEMVKQGGSKRKALQRSKSGTQKARIAFFEEL
ncbi:hypothetical protein EMCRGX_G024083 [Ephydatia muelleri]